MLAIAAAAATVFLASSASAQLSGLTSGLSSSCQQSAAGLLAGDFATCANLIGLVSIITAQGSVISPVNNYISGVCTSSPCSNSTLQQAASTLKSGCQTDINNDVPAAIALNTVITDYPDVRDLLCLQATSNSSYCVTDTLTNIQTANGSDITVASVQSLLTGGTARLFSSLNNIPASAYCTDCGHAIFSVAQRIGQNATGSSSATTSAGSAVASKCGSSFTDGKIPSSVKEAGSSSSASSSGAPSASASNSAASGSLGFSSRTAVLTSVVGAVGVVVGMVSVFA